jgi:hypothetical protein
MDIVKKEAAIIKREIDIDVDTVLEIIAIKRNTFWLMFKCYPKYLVIPDYLEPILANKFVSTADVKNKTLMGMQVCPSIATTSMLVY